jgi:hypothetical protein
MATIWSLLPPAQQTEILRRWGEDPVTGRGSSEAPWLGTLYAFWAAAHRL